MMDCEVYGIREKLARMPLRVLHYSNMTDVQPHNQTPGNPFEFGITLLICVAVAATIAVAIAGISYLVVR
jgi:hypothetical protein